MFSESLVDRLPAFLLGHACLRVDFQRVMPELALQLPVALPSRRIDRAAFECGADRAARFGSVGAIAKPALPRGLSDLVETLVEHFLDCPELQFPHPRTIDDRATFR